MHEHQYKADILGRTFSTMYEPIHHFIRETFWTTETTLQFDLNLTKRLNETINIQLPNITSLETPLNSHQQLCVNSILTDSEHFMNMGVHWMQAEYNESIISNIN